MDRRIRRGVRIDGVVRGVGFRPYVHAPATRLRLAARLHNGVAAAILAGCVQARVCHGLDTMALSGGVFQNVLLLTRTVKLLADNGFRVLTHRRLPTSDGGVSLGQAAVAAHAGPA